MYTYFIQYIIDLYLLDTAMQINTAMFEQTGKCGYVLKPQVMWDKQHVMYGKFSPWEKEYDDLQATTFTVHVCQLPNSVNCF